MTRYFLCLTIGAVLGVGIVTAISYAFLCFAVTRR